MKNMSDSQLVNLYQSGQEKALSTLIQRHQEAIYSSIFYKVRSAQLANDLFQDTFVKIIVTLKKKKYNEEGKFLPWARRIAQNLVIDYFRRQSNHKTVSETTYQNEDFSIFDTLSAKEESIEDKLIEEQINENLLQMIDLLPEVQQEVVRLRFFAGLSFKEIAEQTDSSINTTLGRLRYAIINLRKIKSEQKIRLS